MSLEAQSRLQRKLIAAARVARAHLPPALPPALFFTDPARTPDPLTIASRLPRGFGVVYRHFGAADRSEAGKRLAWICRQRGLVFLVGADPRLALEIGADGVHWPFRLRTEARRWDRRFRLQTVSAHSGRELREVQDGPADAVVLSTAFASSSPSAGPALGPVRLRQLVQESALPVYALGGMTADTAGMAAKVAGIAAVDGMKAFGPIRT